MARLQIMDHTGHSTVDFSKADKVSLAEAEARFNELMERKFIASAPGKDGAPGTLLKSFDPDAETIIMNPPLQGG